MKQALIAALAISVMSGPAIAETNPNKLPLPSVSEAHDLTQNTVAVLDSHMAYLEAGSGEVILFVHGNPTSSYLWRNVLPYVSDTHRAVAVDLIGMGQSGKPDIAYSFEDHFRYLDAFVQTLGDDKIILVGHDWGAALSWAYAQRNPQKVEAIAFMEGVLPPAFPQPSFDAMGEEMGGMFRAFKDPVQGREMIIKNNMFVTEILPGFVNRPLGEAAMAAYTAPFMVEADREPVLAWPQEVPIAGEPAATVDALQKIDAFMSETDLPVLLLYAEPGALVPPQAVPWYTQKIANIETGFVGQGLHFIQEDQPDAIGRAIQDWVRRH